MEGLLGICPWCMAEVRAEGESGKQPVEHTIVHGEPRWWHQGCIADLYTAQVETP